ncbi:MAG: hypothetical protein QM534_04335 [Sediminibacterium sp.]|nr:hypothetical protein [Sediminibacterium sp.]
MENSSNNFEQITQLPINCILSWYGVIANNFDNTGMGIGSMVGWALCNGNNGTPDLMRRFVIGADGDPSDPSGFPMSSTGGQDSQTLSIINLPEHDHSIDHGHSISDPGHEHSNAQPLRFTTLSSNGSGTGVWSNNNAPTNNTTIAFNNKTDITINDYSGYTGPTGQGTSFSIVPPYIALFYIMKMW